MKNSVLPDLSKVIERTGKTLLVIITIFAVLVLAQFLVVIISEGSQLKLFHSIFDFRLMLH
jgi:hypothetical protein